jgi:aminoglycoside 6'-N-acetyltransferase I
LIFGRLQALSFIKRSKRVSILTRDLREAVPTAIDQAAEILFEAFRENWPEAWPDLESAQREVAECLNPERACLGAFDQQSGRLLGWIGAIPEYKGRVWEVHPLAVDGAARGQGIGRQLMLDLEKLAAERGVQTLWLGSDDENDLTSLAGVDLYPDPLRHLAEIRDKGGHPFAFYQKLGFSLAGVLPDANGPGKPDIFLAKRVG